MISSQFSSFRNLWWRRRGWRFLLALRVALDVAGAEPGAERVGVAEVSIVHNASVSLLIWPHPRHRVFL